MKLQWHFSFSNTVNYVSRLQRASYNGKFLLRREWLHRVEVPRRDTLIVLIIDNRTERVDVVRLPLIDMTMNARLHLIGHVRPAALVLRNQRKDALTLMMFAYTWELKRRRW